MNEIDASQHIRLIYRVVGQMGLTEDDAEEAASEGLVALTKACQSFDKNRGVPLASWLAKNIRWSINNMRKRNSRILGRAVELKPDFASVTSSIDGSKTELTELIRQAERILTPVELQIIMAGAWGYKQSEIAKKLNMSPVAVFRAKKKARAKLEKIRDG